MHRKLKHVTVHKVTVMLQTQHITSTSSISWFSLLCSRKDGHTQKFTIMCTLFNTARTCHSMFSRPRKLTHEMRHNCRMNGCTSLKHSRNVVVPALRRLSRRIKSQGQRSRPQSSNVHSKSWQKAVTPSMGKLLIYL